MSGHLPNFLIIGAGKSGTTSLHNYLAAHPEVYMSPIKEPKFFAYMNESPEETYSHIGHPYNHVITKLDEYRALFAGVVSEKAYGESSPQYIAWPTAAILIQHYMPRAKLIAILRQPVDRAFSSYGYEYSRGRETGTFEDAVNADLAGARSHWRAGRVIDVGFYAKHLELYYSLFPQNQIKVVLYDDLKADPKKLMRSIYEFLEVDTSFQSEYRIHNARKAVVTESDWLSRMGARTSELVPESVSRLLPRTFKTSIKKMMEKPAPELDTEYRKELNQLYIEDILKLEKLIGRDLHHWLA